jgi:hypothetical protein
MGYYVYDENDYVGDFAATFGLWQLRSFVEGNRKKNLYRFKGKWTDLGNK